MATKDPTSSPGEQNGGQDQSEGGNEGIDPDKEAERREKILKEYQVDLGSMSFLKILKVCIYVFYRLWNILKIVQFDFFKNGWFFN